MTFTEKGRGDVDNKIYIHVFRPLLLNIVYTLPQGAYSALDKGKGTINYIT